MKKKPVLQLLALSATLALGATACAQSAPSAEEPAESGELVESGELIELTVGMLPIPDMIPLQWADDKGVFEEYGLDVTLETLQGGPVGVQKVATGELEFSFSNQISTMIAQDAGAPVLTLGMLSAAGDETIGIFVREDSPVQSIEDLDGLTIATNTVNNVGDVTFKSIVAHQELDVEPTWIEVPYPEIAAGVERKSVDAGFLPEPFATAGREAGLRKVVDLTVAPNTGMPTTGFITSKTYAAEHPEVVQAFQEAIEEARTQIAGDETAFREWLSTVSQLSPEDAARIKIPDYVTPMTEENIADLAELLKSLGLVSDEFNSEESLQLLGA